MKFALVVKYDKVSPNIEAEVAGIVNLDSGYESFTDDNKTVMRFLFDSEDEAQVAEQKVSGSTFGEEFNFWTDVVEDQSKLSEIHARTLSEEDKGILFDLDVDMDNKSVYQAIDIIKKLKLTVKQIDHIRDEFLEWVENGECNVKRGAFLLANRNLLISGAESTTIPKGLYRGLDLSKKHPLAKLEVGSKAILTSDTPVQSWSASQFVATMYGSCRSYPHRDFGMVLELISAGAGSNLVFSYKLKEWFELLIYREERHYKKSMLVQQQEYGLHAPKVKVQVVYKAKCK